MTQALVIRKINSLKNSFLAKCFGTAFLLFLTLCSFPSVAQSVTSGAISISKIDVINETYSGAIDGKIQVTINDLNAAPSHYRISYDFLTDGNKFVSEELTAVKGVLTLKNAKIGNYYNLRVIRTADNRSSEFSSPVSLKNSTVTAINGFQDPTPTNVTCSTIGYTDCAGTARSITNAESGKGYSSFSDWRPCGFEITSSCTITQIGRWHCIDGNLSTPPASNKYNITDYTGVGLTALQACRLNWIVCNYAYNAADVANAIWYICGTGGVNNTIAQAAVSAVPAANGTESLIKFYKSINGAYQDAIKWECKNVPCSGGRVTGLYFNELNGGTDLPITNGASFTVNQLGLLYNLEAATSGTIGSVKFTISGPSATSNIENFSPYNSPATGGGAWTGAVGTYTVNLKTYSESGGAGNLCHDTTITFYVTNPDCSCVTSTSNLLVNPSFENGTTGWSWSGGSLTTGTGYVTCGAANGFNNWSSGTSKVWQDVTMTPGSTVTFKGYAGTHTPGISCSPMLSLIFLNSSNAVLTQTNVTVTRDVDVNNSKLELYTITAVAPAGTAKVRVQNSITCNTLKIDAFCLTATPGCNINAGTDGSTTVCDNSTTAINLFNIITGEQSGGTWSRVSGTGGTFVAASGTFTPAAGATTSTFRYVVTGTTVCANDTSIATVVINPQANAGADGSTTVCDTLATAVNLYNLISGEQSGGTWSRVTGTGGTFNAAAGTFLPAVGATNSTFRYVKAGTAPCPNDTSVATVNIQSCQLLTLGNRVWYDANNNGLNDASENGIRNVSVKLYADANNDNVADGAAIATTTTDVNGNYSFTNLVPGNYIVGVVVPNGYMSSSVNGGDPDNNIDLDDNGQVVSGNEVRGLAITLASGTEPGGSTNNTYDFGLLPDCSCPNSASNLLVNPSFENGTTGWSWSGGSLTTGTGYIACGAANGFNNWSTGTAKVWQDVSNVAVGSTVDFKAFAGTHTPGISCSPKLSLIFLNASNVVISQTDVTVTRDVDINYSQLEQYSISAVVPAGTAKVRVQSSITCNTMKIDAFCLVVTAVPLGSIGDRVWNDTDGDGIQDAGEVGVAGVTLVLLNSAGQPIATTTTDAFGNYKFSGLPAGNYSVRVTPPSNYTLSAKTQGADTNLDSDFDPITYTTGTVTLAAGQNRTDIDAGLKFTQPSTASVGDRVWYDANANGNQDAGEPGVSNVLVTLYNSSNVAVRSTYTDVNGNYLFTDVTPGSYTVGVSLPPAFVFTTNSGAVSGATNSDIVPATGRTAAFTVNAGDQITYVDGGIKAQNSANGSVGDYVWNDINKNGFQEPGEPGIAGVTVRLLDGTTNAVIATTTTDINGKYIFNDLPAGNYKVEFVTPAGYTTTTKLNSNVTASGVDSDVDPVNSRTATFALAAGQRITTVDAGYWLTTPPGTGKIGDRVWLDANQNGIQDATEASVQGVTVTLYDAANTAIKMAVTDANGNYLFTDLAAGNYTVGFSNLPAGYTFTTQGLGTAANGSDANPATGKTATIALAAGQINLDVDAGIRSSMAGTGSIGNRVWADLNNNGLQDAIEPGIQGVTVELLDAAGNPIDKDPNTAGVQPTTTVTNALGEYLFTGLAAGDYKVRFSTLPAGYNASPKAAGTNRDIDSDGNPIAAGTSTTDVVSLAAGEERLDIDFGLFNPTAPLGQIGDFVWFDSNNNGVQDATEQGVPGVTVTLINASNTVVATTVTDGNGNYRFVNVADGSYTVKFSNLPAGFTFSAKDAGGNDNTDSDADPATGTTGTYTISGGNTNLTVDAGIYSTRAALGDYVWFDANSNGTQDAAEKGIPGITVTLYDAANVAVTSAVTDQNGRYFFSNLNAGTYTVGFGTTPGKLVFTTKDVVSAGDAADSDVDPATGKTGSYSLVAGQVNLTVDAGLKPLVPATVGDYVWFDLNRDGIQDADEPGVPGVLVTLYNAANQPAGSAVTDGNGYYLISNVAAGNGYYTVFSNTPDPAAPFTLQNVGGAAATDNSKADATGKSTPFNVAEGENVSNIDAGIYRLINIHGNVWNDANGLTDLQINRTGVQAIPNSLNIYLVDVATNQVVQAESINQDGTYNFFNVDVNHSYVVVLSTIVAFPGQASPIPFLPSGWQRVGENLGAGPLSGSDGVPNGLLFIDTETSDIFDANFGIRVSSGEVIVG